MVSVYIFSASVALGIVLGVLPIQQGLVRCRRDYDQTAHELPCNLIVRSDPE